MCTTRIFTAIHSMFVPFYMQVAKIFFQILVVWMESWVIGDATVTLLPLTPCPTSNAYLILDPYSVVIWYPMLHPIAALQAAFCCAHQIVIRRTLLFCISLENTAEKRSCLIFSSILVIIRTSSLCPPTSVWQCWNSTRHAYGLVFWICRPDKM